jgi:PKD repeat protein
MRRERRIFTILVAVVAALGGTTTGASVALGDIGTEGFSYGLLGRSPTQTKPESKLWFNDGSWWASMFSPSAGAHRIHRLAGSWVDTGTALDARNAANADVLWHAASSKLYVASHVFVENGRAADPGEEGRLYRYSYDAATDSYALDPGYPVVINGAKSESLVIDLDSLGRLWATWTQDGRVYVNHTDGNDASWGTPYAVPGSTGIDPADDLSSLVAFGGNRIGVMWSNQLDGDFWFASHDDGAGDNVWSTTPIGGLPLSDDHVSLRADAGGRVFAAVKTSENTGSRPLVMLLRRNVSGTWDSGTFGTVSDSHTRPIVVLQEPAKLARVYATCPQPPATSGQSGGDICEKTTSLDGSLSFSSGGRGTPVMSDTGFPYLNDVTSTKQPVSGATQLALLANEPNDFFNRYWHATRSLGSSAPAAVVAGFGAAPTAGVAPLTVQFADASTGGPGSWSWSFGDGTTSSARSPAHTYMGPGTYAVSLTVASTTGRNTQTRAGLITVAGSPPATGGGVAGSGGAQPGTAPGGSVAGRTAAGRRIRITLFKRNLSGRRVRLSGSVSPRLNGVRVTLQRRSSTGRWSNLRTARLLSYTRTRSRFVFVVKRLSRTVGYRIVVPAASGRARTLTAALTVKRRR